jgi:hypothetical protein
MTDLQKQTIRDLYETGTDVQKGGLRLNFPEAFELQNGVWYTYSDVEGYLVKFTDVENRMAFGCSPHTGWSSGSQKWDVNNLVEATPKQIRKILHEVRAKKGLIAGARVINGNKYRTIKGICTYSEILDSIVDDYGCADYTVIFDGHHWAVKSDMATKMSKEVAEQTFNIEIVD